MVAVTIAAPVARDGGGDEWRALPPTRRSRVHGNLPRVSGNGNHSGASSEGRRGVMNDRRRIWRGNYDLPLYVFCVCLCLSLSVCLSNCPHISVSVFICLCVRLFICLSLFICLCTCVFLYLFLYVSVSLWVYMYYKDNAFFLVSNHSHFPFNVMAATYGSS